MTCTETEILLHALLDGELDAGHAREVEVHVAHCPHCGAQMRAYRELQQAMAATQLRFTAPGVDTFVYRDPDMKQSPQWIQGQLTDSRWRIRYKVPVHPSKSKSASVDVHSLWVDGGSYSLDGMPQTP